jgi:uncharacterized iron-regulated membrane protein
MSLSWTLVLLFGGIGLAGLSLWQERRPREIGALRFPATLGLAAGIILIVLALGHLVTLETGRAFTGRRQF